MFTDPTITVNAEQERSVTVQRDVAHPTVCLSVLDTGRTIATAYLTPDAAMLLGQNLIAEAKRAEKNRRTPRKR